MWLKKLFKRKSKLGLTNDQLDAGIAYCTNDAHAVFDTYNLISAMSNRIVLRLIFEMPESREIITRDVTVNERDSRIITLQPTHIQWLTNDRARLFLRASDVQGIYKTVDFDLVDTIKETEGLYHILDAYYDRLSSLKFIGFSVVSISLQKPTTICDQTLQNLKEK